MKSQIMLLLNIIFTIILLKKDFKRISYLSPSFWIPFLWTFILGSRFVSMWLNMGNIGYASPDMYLEGSPIDRVVFLLLIFLGILTLLKFKIYWLEILKKNFGFILFLSYCGLSIMWSNFHFVSFKRWIKELGNYIMILSLFNSPLPKENMKTIIKMHAYITIPLSIIFIKYFPYLGRSYSRGGIAQYHGVTTSKNGLGLLCMLCGLFFIYNLSTALNEDTFIAKKEIFITIIFLLMIGWLMHMSNSATSLFCVVIGLIIFFCSILQYF